MAKARTKARAKAAPWRNRVLRLERVRAGDLAASESNWRRHPPVQVALERWQNYTGRKAVKISDGNSHQD